MALPHAPKTVQQNRAFQSTPTGLHGKTGIRPGDCLHLGVRQNMRPQPRRRIGKGGGNKSRVGRSVLRRERRANGLRAQTRKPAAQFGGVQLFQRQAPGRGSIGKMAHVGVALCVKDQAHMAGGAKLDIAAQQCFGLCPQRPRPVGQGQLRQKTPRAPDIAKGRRGGPRADGVGVYQRDSDPPAGQENAALVPISPPPKTITSTACPFS